MAEFDSEKLLKHYADGERSFRLADMYGINLAGADLSQADFTGADISGGIRMRNLQADRVELSFSIRFVGGMLL